VAVEIINQILIYKTLEEPKKSPENPGRNKHL
jgi:hypothetical protein